MNCCRARQAVVTLLLLCYGWAFECRAKAVEGFDLEQRRRTHWAWKPIQRPSLPAVHDDSWCLGPTDRFLLARLESLGLVPAPEADRRTLLRRVYFDLIGLPPRPEATDAFLRDNSADAYEKVVDGLLNSPQFGERWARHWLDLVRYAETLGHEFDYPIPNAWRYRDYVIRALNADVPYNQFVVEHIAGDLLEHPRRHPTEGFNESVIGTGFYWFTQQVHSPVDVRQHQADLIDNQIDVLTKTFLGLTVSCARCHDHKFDAISTRDYYALYGILESSRYDQAAIDPPGTRRKMIDRLSALKTEMGHQLGNLWLEESRHIADYLLAAREVMNGPLNCPSDVLATERNLEARQLDRWVRALENTRTNEDAGLFRAWFHGPTADRQSPARTLAEPPANLIVSETNSGDSSERKDNTDVCFVDFTASGFDGWFVSGDAFGARPVHAGEVLLGAEGDPGVQIVATGGAHSACLSRRLEGVLRSPTFTLKKRFIHIRAAGRESRLNVVIDDFQLIRDPIYGGLRRALNNDPPHWITVDVGMWQGHGAYLEFSDTSVGDLAGADYGTNGYVAVERILFSDQAKPPAEQLLAAPFAIPAGSAIRSGETLAHRYQKAVIDALKCLRGGDGADSPDFSASADLVNWMLRNKLLSFTATDPGDEVKASCREKLNEFRATEASLSAPNRVAAMTDGTEWDECVFVRGNHRTPGERVPRRFLEALSGENQPPWSGSCGRLELAHRMTDPANPFLARVMVNRVWHHLFGRGIVASVDNFGALGEPPSHPELLDWLADWFRSDAGWSNKKLIRLLVMSRAYRMASSPTDAAAEEKDPTNVWLHRMPVRRLEAEAIRDSLLQVSGRLNLQSGGPSIPIHLTPFMSGRGRPSASGSLDGEGRRSIYVEVRRNFLSPMMLAYDTPIPFTTVGRRTVSNVPAQALTLMNDPFVAQQAESLARHTVAGETEPAPERIERLFETLFGRPPGKSEMDESLAFLDAQSSAYRDEASASDRALRAWTDLCHVLFNVKEFVFIN